jgi:hypothetical protein
MRGIPVARPKHDQVPFTRSGRKLMISDELLETLSADPATFALLMLLATGKMDPAAPDCNISVKTHSHAELVNNPPF